MILSDTGEKIKRLGRGEAYVIMLVLFVGFAAFGLGRLSKIQETRPEISISDAFPSAVAGIETSTPQVGEEPGIDSAVPVLPAEAKNFVGSRNGSKYHYPWCPGAQQIKEENKVWFATRAEAEQAGYTPAANCKGL
ncbi:hypothetical protein L0Y40_03240 [Candidatus Wolfebacteria bacterium]|nr:hypothetical protein [Candidatus Wolfebacteria bacterium]